MVFEKDFMMSLMGESTFLTQDYNIQNIGKKKEKNKALLYSSFDTILDNIYLTNYIADNINTSIKSLTKLAFHYILLNDNKNAIEILDDICILLNEENSIDRDYLHKVKQFKEKAQQKLIITEK